MVTFLSMIKKKIFHPVSLISQFVMGYSLFRFLFEYLRNDSQSEFVGIFTKSQWFFFFFFFFGLLLLRILKRKNRFLLL
ncbi:prolipoprotein diacylglyceryl transferase [bacterium]|nr:prolipoprotein diacylglyceryl transferase [bacterium]